MRKLLYTITALFCMHSGRSQLVYSLDDDMEHIRRMEKEAAAATTDNARAYAYFKLSSVYRLTGDTAKVNDYLRRGTALSKPGSFAAGAAYFYKAQTLYAQRNIPVIEALLMKGDSSLSKLHTKDAAKIRAYIWHAYASFQQIKGSEKDAMDAFLNKALPQAKASEDKFLIGNICKSVGTVFINADRRKEAAEYLRTAISNIEQANPDNPVRIESLVESYIYAAENYVYDQHPDSAKPHLDKAAAILSPHPNSNLYLTYYFAEGVYYDKLKQYDKALVSFNKGIDLGQQVPSAVYAVNRLLFAKYKSLYNQKYYMAAIPVMQQLLKNPVAVATDKKIYLKELSVVHAAAGNKAAAYDWAAQYIAVSDSLYEAKFQHDVVELEKKYNNAENQKKIALLQAAKEKAELTSRNNKLLAWLLGGCSVLLLVLALMSWLLYRNKKKEQKLKLAEALLQGEEKERKRLAGDLHDGLGGMLAGVKINLSRLTPADTNTAVDLPLIILQLDKSVNELRRIARNLMPESLLTAGLETALREICETFHSKELSIEFQAFNLQNDVPKDLQVTIFRIVQELLTNAIRHAGASGIVVQCSQNAGVFYITVEDNGKGFDLQAAGQRKGIGLTNVQNRVDYLKGKLEIDSAPGSGTTVNIEFNVGR